MSLRPYQLSDGIALRRMFEKQGFEYDCPDFNDPGLISKTIFESSGLPRMAIIARLTAEAYFLVDKDFGTPIEKWRAFLELHEAARKDCFTRGLDDIFCWIPPQIEKSFGRRLLRIGWGKNKWSSFNRLLIEPTKDAKCASTLELSAT